MFELTINENQENLRLDKVLRKVLREAPDSFLYKMMRKKNITLNGKKVLGNERVEKGDRIQFFLSEETLSKMRGEVKKITAPAKKFPEIPVLYRDEDVLIFVKPQGVLSQKAEEGDYSVNDWVISYASREGLISDSQFETFRPSICNRLDRNTSGIMAAGLSLRGLQTLSELFRDRTLSKFYYAIVYGKTKEKESLHGFLVKNQGKNTSTISDREKKGDRIDTEYELVKYDEQKNMSLVRVHLLTGKSHQIRAHLASVGHPILGDPKYGNQNFNLANHKNMQCLVSYHLSFPTCDLPGISGKTFEIPVPKDWPLQP